MQLVCGCLRLEVSHFPEKKFKPRSLLSLSKKCVLKVPASPQTWVFWSPSGERVQKEFKEPLPPSPLPKALWRAGVWTYIIVGGSGDQGSK